jgi:hypothetical protein
VTGQGVIGRYCAWCGLPATTEVEVQPAHYRHDQITRGQPAAVPIPRQRTARGVDQLGLFATPSGGETR